MIRGLDLGEVDPAAEVGVRNSQPEGIGRVVALNGLVSWNNLGRNVVFADRTLRANAIFGTTLFPGDDENSQYDLDVHAVLDAPERDLVLVLNHFGTVRGFRRSDLAGYRVAKAVEPVALWSFAGDVERAVIVAGRLIGSAPRSEGGSGVLVSAPLPARSDGDIPIQPAATAFGEVTALAIVSSVDRPLIALGGDGRLALVSLDDDRLTPPRWEVEVGFRVASIEWRDGVLWAAGPARVGVVDDYDWEQLSGGGFAALDLHGTLLVAGPLPGDVAWGAGGVAVVVIDGSLLAAGRTGCLRLVDPRNPGQNRSTPPLADASLGIAHVAVAGQRILCGFNRGGYRLHASGPVVSSTA